MTTVNERAQVETIEIPVELKDLLDEGGFARVATIIEIEGDENNAFVNSMAKNYICQEEHPWHRPEDGRVVVKVAAVQTTSMG